MFHLVPTHKSITKLQWSCSREKRVRHKIEMLFIQFIHAIILCVHKCIRQLYWTLLSAKWSPTLVQCACSKRQITWKSLQLCERGIDVGAFMTRQWKSVYNIWSGSKKNLLRSMVKCIMFFMFLFLCGELLYAKVLRQKIGNLDNNITKDKILWFT